MANREPKAPGGESVYLVILAVALGAGWFIWTKARPGVIMPLFALDWVEYKILKVVHLLNDKQGINCLAYLDYFMTHPAQTMTMDWQIVRGIQTDIGVRMRWPLSIAVVACAVFTAFKMKGDGFKQIYTLTGRSLEDVVRVAGVPINTKWLRRFLTADYKWIIIRWPVNFFLKVTFLNKIVKIRKEWIKKGSSFMDYQASHWKVTMPGARFDPDKLEANELPQFSPMEWLKINKVSLRKGELDEEAAERSFARQLGPSWQGIEQAPYHVQAIMVMSALNFQRDKKINALREKLTEIHVLRFASAEQETREVLSKYLKDKTLVDLINQRAGKHAFLNTAVVGVYGAGGPMREWGGGEAGVLATSMFRWLKAIDRTLWYCLNNVGRRAYHIEGAGVVSHFQAERISKQPLIDPYMEDAIDGLLSYLDVNAIEDLETFFRKENKF